MPWWGPIAAGAASGILGGMFGGGDDDGGSQTQQRMIDPALQQFRDEMFARIRGLADRPYVQEPFSTVAPMSGYTQRAMDMAGESGGWVPGMEGAFGVLGDAINQTSQRNVYTPAEWNKKAAKRYMNPYTKEAVDPVARETRLGYGMDKMNLQSNAASEGAFGGARQALLESENTRNQEQAVSDVYATGYDRAYSSGLDAFGRDADRGLNTAKLNETIRAGDLDRLLSSSSLMSSLTGQMQSLEDNDIAKLFQAGDVEQGYNQSVTNEAHRQWLEERDWGEKALDYYYRGLGAPGSSYYKTENTLPSSNPWAQGAGLGMSLYGMWNQNRGSGGNGWNTGQYFSNGALGRTGENYSFWGDE